MTSNPEMDFDPQGLADAVVELTAPDGTLYRFRYGAVLPYKGQEYVVLVELTEDENEEEQLLITRLSDSPEGELSFEVVAEEDVIQAILQEYTSQLIHGSLDGEGCHCGHSHQEGACDCCGHDPAHGEHSCGDCGCSH